MAATVPNSNAALYPASVQYDSVSALRSQLAVLPTQVAGAAPLDPGITEAAILLDVAARGLEVTGAAGTGLVLTGLSPQEVVRAFLNANNGVVQGIGGSSIHIPLSGFMNGATITTTVTGPGVTLTGGAATAIGTNPFRMIRITLTSFNLATPTAAIAVVFIA